MSDHTAGFAPFVFTSKILSRHLAAAYLYFVRTIKDEALNKHHTDG